MKTKENIIVFFGETGELKLWAGVLCISECEFRSVKVILCSVNTTQLFREEVILYSRNTETLSFEAQDLSLPRFNVNHVCCFGTDQMAL